MMATYYLKGLNGPIKSSVANVDLAGLGGSDELINSATIVEKRLGKAGASKKKRRKEN